MSDVKTRDAKTKDVTVAESTLNWSNHRIRWTIGRLFNHLFRVAEVSVAQKVFRNLPSPCLTTRNLFGYRMHLDLSRSLSQQLLYLMGERHITERALINEHVKPGMSVVDVGANIGYHVLMFAQRIGGSGRITAIEPSPENLTELKANISGNTLKNVDLYEIAVGSRETTVEVRGGINSGIQTEGQGIAAVDMKPLSEVVREKCDFIKIDVDGYEAEVVEGAFDVLRRDRPVLLLELHPHLLPRFGSNVQTVVARLREIYNHIEGYDQFRAKEDSVIRRVLRRYAVPDKLRAIDELDSVIELADADQHNWTFWIIARNV
ncbi:FkbM family methyltransferase [Stieleria varia]|nr:FkbM family methyltransferase [Stieleria varia]